ncbi:MAG: extracellular solute-binding protein [Lachnospiraceae bacterium]|nr:extracellular solute-binding protein [Lachnospiraceae bacterium]
MKKKLLSILLSTAMVATLLAGCGSNDNSSNTTTGTPDTSSNSSANSDAPAPAPVDLGDEIVELSVLNYIDMSEAGAIEELEVVWAAFEAAYPNIKINRFDEFEEAYHQSIEAYAAAGALPDVTYCWPSGRSTTLHTQKLLKDLTPLAARDGLGSTYVPLALDPFGQANNYLAMLPQGVTATNMFIVNKEVLDAVGLTPAKTYSELAAQVPILRDAGYECVIMPNLSEWVMQSCLYSLVIGRFMGEDWDERILSGETNWTDPAVIASLNFIKQMYDDGVLAQASLALDYGEGPGRFATNGGAYYIDGDWRVGAFITDGTTGEALIDPSRQANFEITVFPEIDLPGVAIPGRTNSAVLGTGWGMNANIESGSVKEEAAWTLIKWLVGKEVQEFRLRTGGISTPTRTDINFGALTLEPLQVALAGMGNDYDKATVVVDGVFESPVFTPLNEGLQALGLGTMTAEEVANNVQAAFESWSASQ